MHLQGDRVGCAASCLPRLGPVSQGPLEDHPEGLPQALRLVPAGQEVDHGLGAAVDAEAQVGDVLGEGRRDPEDPEEEPVDAQVDGGHEEHRDHGQDDVVELGRALAPPGPALHMQDERQAGQHHERAEDQEEQDAQEGVHVRAARPGRLAAQEHAEVVVDTGDQQRQGPEQRAHHGRQALGPTAPIPGGKDDRQAALRADGWQEADAGEDHAEPRDPGHGADVVGKGAQEAPRVQNGEHSLTKEVADVRAGQVQEVDREGAPLDGEAEKPEDQPVAHQAAQTEEQEDVVHDGRRRQHGDLLDGQEATAVELGGLAHAGTHLCRCGGGDAVMLAGPTPTPAPASRCARLRPRGFLLAQNLPSMQETQV